jgi:hypothetical protein
LEGALDVEEKQSIWKIIFVLPFKTMEIMVTCFFFIHMNVKELKPKIHLKFKFRFKTFESEQLL